jgi:hypothetical protein
MNKLNKIVLSILASAFLFSTANAGDLSVTGGVTATWGKGEDSSGLGISNELDFSASGELDNGVTWNWQTQLDDAGTVNDDTSLVFGTSMGKVALNISEGGLASKYGYGVGAMGAGSDYSAPATVEHGVNTDAYNNVQYHTPAGLLPFGLTAKVAFVPNLSDAQGASAKSVGTIETKAVGDSASHVRVDASPIEGLTIGADYATVSGAEKNSSGNAIRYKQESAGAYAKFVTGPFTIGVSKSGYQPSEALAGANTVGTVNYETDSYGVMFAVNDNLTVSYSQEKSTKHTGSVLGVTASRTAATDVEYEIDHIQAAYVVGGATFGLAIADASNVGYASGRNTTTYIASMAIAF